MSVAGAVFAEITAVIVAALRKQYVKKTAIAPVVNAYQIAVSANVTTPHIVKKTKIVAKRVYAIAPLVAGVRVSIMHLVSMMENVAQEVRASQKGAVAVASREQYAKEITTAAMANVVEGIVIVPVLVEQNAMMMQCADKANAYQTIVSVPVRKVLLAKKM